MSLMRIVQAGFHVQVFDAEVLIKSLDASSDLPDGQGMENFDTMLIMKYMEVPPRLYDDLMVMGIEQPILVEIEDDYTWTMIDGHHRLAWASIHIQPVPVCFVNIDTDATALYELLSEFEVEYEYALTD